MMYREKDYLLKVMTDSNDIAKASTLPEMIEKSLGRLQNLLFFTIKVLIFTI